MNENLRKIFLQFQPIWDKESIERFLLRLSELKDYYETSEFARQDTKQCLEELEKYEKIMNMSFKERRKRIKELQEKINSSKGISLEHIDRLTELDVLENAEQNHLMALERLSINTGLPRVSLTNDEFELLNELIVLCKNLIQNEITIEDFIVKLRKLNSKYPKAYTSIMNRCLSTEPSVCLVCC